MNPANNIKYTFMPCISENYISEALGLALEWLVGRTVAGQRCLICSDSKAALAALDSGSPGVGSNLSNIRQLLGQVRSTVLLQWVPGRCGLLGNEWAAADRAGEPRPVSWAAAKALIDRAIVDHPLQSTLVSGWCTEVAAQTC